MKSQWLTQKGENPLMRPDLQPAGRSLESALMKYKNDEYHAREGGALKAAQNLAIHERLRAVSAN